MERFYVLLMRRDGNLLVIGGFAHKGPVMHYYIVIFILTLNKLLNKQSSFRWFEAFCCYDHQLLLDSYVWFTHICQG